jgi:hypothetical protein
MAVMKTEGGEPSIRAATILSSRISRRSRPRGTCASTADGKPDHTLMGNAWTRRSILIRGNTYDGPNKSQALARLKALYKR